LAVSADDNSAPVDQGGAGRAVGAGGVLFEDCGAACSAEFVALRVGSLFLGRDPRIADQTTCGGSFLAFGCHGGD
jgi:hypothetical protein